jgi:hypothetical protein
VIQAWEAALFDRGFQFLIPRREGGWLIPGESTGYGPSMQLDLALLPTNIYSAYGQMLISALTRSVPNTRFEPGNADDDTDITAAESSGKFIKVFKRNNDLISIQTDAGRYLWCDGRFLYWTRFVKDGQRFGWEEEDEDQNPVPENMPPEAQADEQIAAKEVANEEGEQEEEIPDVQRTPRGQEVRTAHGKLEVKLVPMMANTLPECHALQFEQEVDISTAKGMFPDVADDIKSGPNGISEGEIARLARLNVKLGMQSTYITSDSIADDTTLQRTWFRRSAFMSCKKDEVRKSLIKRFPDGCVVCYAGETLCYVRNGSMDDEWALGQAYSGDGQNRNALGTSLMPVQKRLNNWLDLMNDFFVRCIPKKWFHNKAFNIEAIKAQTNIPGDSSTFKPQPGMTAQELVFCEPQVTAPTSLPDFVKQYSGPLAELVTGGYPALSGGDTGSNDTAKGIQTQRDQALGRLGPTWHSMQNAEAASDRQAVRWGAKCRDSSVNERIPGGEAIRLEINNLRGNIKCFAESDENFPETYTQKQNRVMQFFEMAAKNPMLGEVLYNPANLQFLQMIVALDELYIPQVAAYNKQLGELELLLKAAPIPNPQYEDAVAKLATYESAGHALAQQRGAPGMDPAALAGAKQQLEAMPKEISSVPVRKSDDSATEAMACWKFLNSPEGREAALNNQAGFNNVTLHWEEHMQAAAQKQGGAQAKPPSESINYKDLPPDGQVQLAAKGGITLDAAKLEAEDQQDKATAALAAKAKASPAAPTVQ